MTAEFPSKLRKAIYQKSYPENVCVVEEPFPDLRPTKDSVICRVICAGVNPVDAKLVMGDKFPEFMLPIVKRCTEGCTVGFDFAGTVVRTHPSSPFQIGDAVFGTVPPFAGTMATYIRAPLSQIAKKPRSLSWPEAAALPLVGLTALQSLRDDYALQAGQRLLVIGATGGVGHVAVQVAKALGAHVTGVCSGANDARARAWGADDVVDYKAGDVAQALRSLVDEKGIFNMVLDTVTSHDKRDKAFKYEKTIQKAEPPLLRGMYVKIGGATREWAVAGVKRLTGLNLFPRHRELFWIRFPRSVQALDTLARWADEGRLRPEVGELVDFNDSGVQGAFRKLHTRRAVGKLVVRVDPFEGVY